jgi:hypothetical protein
VITIIIQLVFWNKQAASSDPTFDQWPVVVANQIVQAASIISTCLPQLKAFLVSLQSGMLGADDLRRRNQIGISGYDGPSYPSKSSQSGGKSRKESRVTLPIKLLSLSSTKKSFNTYSSPGGMSNNRSDLFQRISDDGSSVTPIIAAVSSA